MEFEVFIPRYPCIPDVDNLSSPLGHVGLAGLEPGRCLLARHAAVVVNTNLILQQIHF